jgi:hypothetical protein
MQRAARSRSYLRTRTSIDKALGMAPIQGIGSGSPIFLLTL